MCATTIFFLDFHSFTHQFFKSLKISAYALYCTSQVRSTARGQRAKVSLNCSTQPDLAIGTPQLAIIVMPSATVPLFPNLVISSAILARASRPELRGPADHPVGGSFQFPHWQCSSLAIYRAGVENRNKGGTRDWSTS